MPSLRNVIAAAALALFQTTQAWNVELPSCLDPFQPYVYVGCFNGHQDSGKDTLIYRSSQDLQVMTVEKCVAECKGNGFRYAGLKYYGVCFCGATVNSKQLDESACTLPCAGDPTETCGGDAQMSVWSDPTFDTGVRTIADFKSLGCYTDSSPKGRALSWGQDLPGGTMTPKICLGACNDGGFPLAGLEYGGECWCGMVLANDTAPALATDCSMPCNGDALSMCGGSNRMNLYVSNELISLQPCGYVSGTSSSIVQTSSTTAQTVARSSSTAAGSSSIAAGSSSTAAVSSSTAAGSTSTIVSSSSTATISSSTVTASSSTSRASVSSSTSTSTSTAVTAIAAGLTSTAAGSTSTAAGSSSSTSSTQSTTSTTAPATTTTRLATTTTASVAMCTSAITLPNSCEYKCGSWCAPSVPDFQDLSSCTNAYKTCAKMIGSCFQAAGWPGALDCFDFSTWCSNIQTYCTSSACTSGKCAKKDCLSKYKPVGGNVASTTTSVFPCSATTATTTIPASASTSCAPEPTNICTQPSSWRWGYGPGNAAGDIDLPLVSCNDLQTDFNSGRPFKLYTNKDSASCKGYSRAQTQNACADACKAQYDGCTSVYVTSCQKFGGKSYFARRAMGTTTDMSKHEKRWFNIWGSDSASTAQSKCQAQYNDCLSTNSNVYTSRCTKWGTGM
ncbi:hypothetical protein AK830_g9266 [Neonectria ditissima]|uniref:WSC domain-containing protein n=1 Tax=Neonectria ditissima TaxID=78410 RepID=A0A0P7AIK0_9HYPO|nr:hypothetical protein AK830_g9266 [Neonectria ditissima]